MDAATDNQTGRDEFLAQVEIVGSDGFRADFKELVGRASELFDDDSAQAHCEQLFARLGEDAGNRIALESVVILALARAALVERLRLPLAQEGRRLAVLLERDGDSPRAQAVLELLLARFPADRAVEHDLSGLMRRNGNLARLIERHLSRADECVRDGRRDEAVRWLREVLMLDPQRRDVARMIRDLNYADTERRGAWRKGFKVAGTSLLCLSAISGVVWREIDIDARFDRIPQAADGDLRAMQARLGALDEIVEQSPLWMGLFRASRERSSLREKVERLRAERAEEQARLQQARALATTLADSQYSLARLAAQQYRFDQMRRHLEAALSYAPDDWRERAQVEREIAALNERDAGRAAAPKGDRP